MSSYECNYKCSCTLIAVIISAFVGIITAFLQITGVITVTPAFLWVTFGIAVGYLGLSLLTSDRSCCCASLNALLIGILGTALFSIVLLAVGITATSTISAILVGILLFFFSLTLGATACRVKCLTDCDN